MKKIFNFKFLILNQKSIANCQLLRVESGGFTQHYFSRNRKVFKGLNHEEVSFLVNSTKSSKNSVGFTLIEVIVAIFVFIILSIGLMALFSGVFTASGKQSNLLADSDQARKVSFNLVSELRNAQVSSTGGYALETAQEQTLIFYSNLDGGADIERVRYFAQNSKLYKGVTKPSGSPLSYNLANEKVSLAQNNLANGTTPIFYYYDGTYDGSTNNLLAQPVNVTAVKLVKLNLKVLNTGGVSNTNYYSITASGAIRNLKTNLGE